MRSKFLLFAAYFLALPGLTLAAQPPRALAMETYRFMDSAQPKLAELIKTGNKADYFSQFSSPAKAIAEKWPRPLTEDYYDYADCNFALDLLIKYADASIVGDSQKTPLLVARKVKFSTAFKECQRDLRKMP